MGLGFITAQNVRVEESLKYLILVNPGSAINAQEGEDYILVKHRSCPPGRAKMYTVEDIVSALLDQHSGDIYREED